MGAWISTRISTPRQVVSIAYQPALAQLEGPLQVLELAALELGRALRRRRLALEAMAELRRLAQGAGALRLEAHDLALQRS